MCAPQQQMERLEENFQDQIQIQSKDQIQDTIQIWFDLKRFIKKFCVWNFFFCEFFFPQQQMERLEEGFQEQLASAALKQHQLRTDRAQLELTNQLSAISLFKYVS